MSSRTKWDEGDEVIFIKKERKQKLIVYYVLKMYMFCKGTHLYLTVKLTAMALWFWGVAQSVLSRMYLYAFYSNMS